MMTSKVRIKSYLLEHLLEVGKVYFPQETCGLILGDEIKDIFDARVFNWMHNDSKELTKWDFNMDPRELGRVLQGIKTGMPDQYYAFDFATWHTHPRGNPIPSQWDVMYAEKFDYQIPWLITSLKFGNTRAWLWNREKFFQELELEVTNITNSVEE